MTITDLNGCTIQEFIAIHEPGQLSINASQTNVSCYGESNGSVVLNVTGGTPACLLYTSDAADDLLCVDLGGRRILTKKKKNKRNINTHNS